MTDADLWAALTLVDADAIVRALPAGLEACVAERGSSLSGSKHQRLALARAILRRPQLLIIDEATNAIGLDAERRILTGLLPAVAGRPC